QIGIVMNGFNYVHQKGKEAQAFFWLRARSQKVYTRISAQRPVVVLTASVNTRKWFFVEQHFQVVALRYFFHQIHQQRVVVDSQVNFFKGGCYLKLARCYLIVARANGHTQLHGFKFKIHHERVHPWRDRTKIVIFQLLSASWRMTKYSTASQHQIRTSVE